MMMMMNYSNFHQQQLDDHDVFLLISKENKYLILFEKKQM